MIGKIICDLVPNNQNNRNSEGAFIKLKNGDLMFAYTHYRGEGSEDHSTADLYAMLSKDEGESFGDPFLIFSCENVEADNIMSVSLMRMKNGDLGLFYLEKHNRVHNCIPYLARSSDEGKTWYEHIRCINEDGYYVLHNDRVIRLYNERLLMPVARHEYKDDTFLPGSVLMYASDDDGRTWNKISNEIKLDFCNVKREETDSLRSCMEPGVAELENGNVWCFIRTKLGRQYETFSEDFGASWSSLQPSPFTSPESPMSVKKLKNGNLFTVWNPIPLYNGRSQNVEGVWTGARTPLVFAVLNKEGDFVSEYKEIETDEKAGFCYCAIHETENGDILLGYCAGGVSDGGCLNKIRIRKIYKSDFNEI